MDQLRKNEKRRDIILGGLAVLALSLAALAFYNYYTQRTQGANQQTNVPTIPDNENQQVLLDRYIQNLNQQNYIISTTTNPPLSLTGQGDLLQLLDASIYTQNSLIKRIDFENANKSILVSGPDIYVLDHTAKTYSSYPNVSNYGSLVNALRDQGFNLNNLYDSITQELNFTRTTNGDWQSNNSINIEGGNTVVAVKINLKTNDSTGFIESFELFYDTEPFSQQRQVEVEYRILSDEDLINSLTLPSDYSSV